LIFGEKDEKKRQQILRLPLRVPCKKHFGRLASFFGDGHESMKNNDIPIIRIPMAHQKGDEPIPLEVRMADENDCTVASYFGA